MPLSAETTLGQFNQKHDILAGHLVCAWQGEGKNVREVPRLYSSRSQGVRAMTELILEDHARGLQGQVVPAPLWRLPRPHRVCQPSDPSPRSLRTLWDRGFQERAT